MRFVFADRKLEALYRTGQGARRYPPQVIEAFLEALAAIDAARDERDLYASKGFHFEKLAGNRQGQYSLRMNRQFRLIVSLAHDQNGRLVWIIELTDYH